jgi:hypothetical protein
LECLWRKRSKLSGFIQANPDVAGRNQQVNPIVSSAITSTPSGRDYPLPVPVGQAPIQNYESSKTNISTTRAAARKFDLASIRVYIRLSTFIRILIRDAFP